jgi:hypothetical protein
MTLPQRMPVHVPTQRLAMTAMASASLMPMATEFVIRSK